MNEEYGSVKRSKLSFKGDVKAKRPKTKRKRDPSATISNQVELLSSLLRDLPDDEGWISCQSLQDLSGPVLFILAHSDGLALSMDPIKGIHLSPTQRVSAESRPDLSYAGLQWSPYEPVHIHQVWVAQRLPDRSTFAFKSAQERYLAVDRFGSVQADAMAVGPQEEWTVTPTATEGSTGEVFQLEHHREVSEFKDQEEGQNASGLVLSGHVLEEYRQASAATTEGRKMAATTTLLGTVMMKEKISNQNETWRVFCQVSAYKKRLVERQKAALETQTKRDRSDQVEAEQVSRSQSWGGGRRWVSQAPLSDLEKARESGRLHEAMLDRREKLKSDKYCK